MNTIKSPLHLVHALEQRKSKGLFRELTTSIPVIDFYSNDYLGFSTQGLLENKLKELNLSSTKNGATGSRLISGNSAFINSVEEYIATFHNAESALLFNSGYDANVGLMSCLPQKEDLVLFDELIHASLYDGMRLSFAQHYKFKHNSLEHIKELLIRYRETYKEIYLVVESIYSMDGDEAPLKELVEICQKYNCWLIVDEAHALGVIGKNGKGLCHELNIEKECLARIYTYGKAMGCHGAAVVGNSLLKTYLVNFARSFIYTTALPYHSVASIYASYHLLIETEEVKKLQENINHFNKLIANDVNFIKSRSAIHCQLITGNIAVEAVEKKLITELLYTKAVKSPTVKEGKERLRICLHAFNTKENIDVLVKRCAK